MKNKKFIQTSSKATKDSLLRMGFTLISSDDNAYVFLNDGKVAFETLEKAVFTDKLCI